MFHFPTNHFLTIKFSGPDWVQCSIPSTISLHYKSFPQHLSLQSPNPFMSNIFYNLSFYSRQNTIPPHHISVPNMSSILQVPCYLMGFQTLLTGCSNPLIRFNSTPFKMKWVTLFEKIIEIGADKRGMWCVLQTLYWYSSTRDNDSHEI